MYIYNKYGNTIIQSTAGGIIVFTFLKDKKKLIFLIIIMLSILLFAMIISYSYVKNISLKKYLQRYDIGNTIQEKNNNVPVKLEEGTLSLTNEKEVLTTEDTIISKKYVYNSCSHVHLLEESISYNDIGITREEFSRRYFNWDIKIFNAKNIVMEKVIEGYCPNHYILQEVDNYIAICQSDIDGNLDIVKKIDISFEYLPKEWKEQFKKGLIMETLEEIEQVIEDIES